MSTDTKDHRKQKMISRSQQLFIDLSKCLSSEDYTTQNLGIKISKLISSKREIIAFLK